MTQRKTNIKSWKIVRRTKCSRRNRFYFPACTFFCRGGDRNVQTWVKKSADGVWRWPTVSNLPKFSRWLFLRIAAVNDAGRIYPATPELEILHQDILKPFPFSNLYFLLLSSHTIPGSIGKLSLWPFTHPTCLTWGSRLRYNPEHFSWLQFVLRWMRTGRYQTHTIVAFAPIEAPFFTIVFVYWPRLVYCVCVG